MPVARRHAIVGRQIMLSPSLYLEARDCGNTIMKLRTSCALVALALEWTTAYWYATLAGTQQRQHNLTLLLDI